MKKIGPGICNVGWRSEEDNERISNALKKIKEHFNMSPDLEKQAETTLLLFIRDESAPRPSGLAQSKKKLERLIKASEEFQIALGDVRNDIGLYSALKREGIDFQKFSDLDLDIGTVQYVMGMLPGPKPGHKNMRWPREPDPQGELILNLARLFSKATGAKAQDHIKHDRTEQKYTGQFYELAHDIFFELDLSFSSRSLGKKIQSLLKNYTCGESEMKKN